MEILKKNFITIILMAFSLIAVLPLFHSGFFNIHDDTQIQRVFEMKTAFSDGVFPVRWVPDLGYGYGYPIFNFYGPLPYYVGAIFMFIGFNALVATKIMILIAVIGSAVSMYFLAKEFWGKIGGLVSALFYIYAPYHALDIYVRGDVGEVYAYLFIPFVFYSLWKYYKTQKFIFIVFGALTYAGIIVSHNLSAMMITPFILFPTLVLTFHKRKYLLFLIPLLGVLIASFYWIPTLLEMNYTNVLSTIGGKAHFVDHFVCVRQFWDSPWMFGGSIPGCIDGISFRVGKLHLLFTALSVFPALYLFRKEKLKSFVLTTGIILFTGTIFLMTKQSNFIWEKIPYMDFFQYPWRFLLVSSFISSFLTGSLVYLASKYQIEKYRILFLLFYLAIIVSSVFLYSKLFVPQNYLNKSSESYTNLYSLNWTTSKISDEYLPKTFKTPDSYDEIIKQKITGENIKVSNVVSRTGVISAQVNSVGENEIIIHKPFFPAWNYYLNDKKIEVKEVENGVSLMISDGDNKIVGKFEQTGVEVIANAFSLCGILILFVGIIYAKRKKHEKT